MIISSHLMRPKPYSLHPKFARMAQGLIDLVERKAFTFEGPNGDEVIEGPIPADMMNDVDTWRAKLVEAVCTRDYH